MKQQSQPSQQHPDALRVCASRIQARWNAANPNYLKSLPLAERQQSLLNAANLWLDVYQQNVRQLGQFGAEELAWDAVDIPEVENEELAKELEEELRESYEGFEDVFMR